MQLPYDSQVTLQAELVMGANPLHKEIIAPSSNSEGTRGTNSRMVNL